jgi:hypothetical protein
MFVLDHLTIRARKTEEEAQTIVEGRAPDCALELLRSSDADILRITCNMLESIARRKGLSITIVKLGLCKAIVSLFGFVSLYIAYLLWSATKYHGPGIATLTSNHRPSKHLTVYSKEAHPKMQLERLLIRKH